MPHCIREKDAEDRAVVLAYDLAPLGAAVPIKACADRVEQAEDLNPVLARDFLMRSGLEGSSKQAECEIRPVAAEALVFGLNCTALAIARGHCKAVRPPLRYIIVPGCGPIAGPGGPDDRWSRSTFLSASLASGVTGRRSKGR